LINEDENPSSGIISTQFRDEGEREREESLKQFIKTLGCIRLVNNTLQIPRTSLKSIFWSDESYEQQQLELCCTQKLNIK